MSFSVNQRVRISSDYHWAKDAVATICAPPDYILSLAPGWEGIERTVPTLNGSQTCYWVHFDEEQMDADGDGPYFEAEIDGAAMSLIE